MEPRKLTPEELAGAVEVPSEAPAPAPTGPRKLSAADLEGAVEVPNEPEKPGFFSRAASTIAGGARAVGHVLADQAETTAYTLRHPIEAVATPEGRAQVMAGNFLTNPSKRRELLRGVGDVTTLGYGNKLAEHVDKSMNEEFGFERHMTPEQQAADAEEAPGYRTTGAIAGGLLPNPLGEVVGVAGKAGAAVAGRAAPAATRAIGKVLTTAAKVPGAGAVKGLANYESQAPLQAALSADAEGHRAEAAKEAALDPAGILTSTVGGAGGQAIRNKVMNSKGAKAREYIEQHGDGAKVGVTTSGKGGVFDKQLAGVPANDAGIGEAAKIGAKGIVEDIENRHEATQGYPYRGGKKLVAEATEAKGSARAEGNAKIAAAKEERAAMLDDVRQEILRTTSAKSKKLLSDIDVEHAVETSVPYKKLKAAIDNSPEARRTRDVAPIVATIQDALNDLETSDFAHGKLQVQLARLERHRDPKSGAVQVNERQLNGLRRSLMRIAKVGQSDVAGEAEAPLRKAAIAAKEMVDQGPYAEANALFAKGSAKREAARKDVGLPGKPGKDRAKEEENLAKRLRKSVEDPTQIPGKNSDADMTPLREKLASARTSAKPAINEARAANEQAAAGLSAAKAKRAAGDAAAIPDRKMLNLAEKVGQRKVDLNQIGLMLEREHQNTATAGRSLAELDKYREAHPDQATNTRLPGLVSSKADLGFTLKPEHGGLFNRVVGEHRGALVPVIAAASGHPLLAWGSYLAGVARANAKPIAGRVLYGPAKRIDVGNRARSIGRVLGATEARREKEKRP